jgi:predicted PurR-regulated permease PerM
VSAPAPPPPTDQGGAPRRPGDPTNALSEKIFPVFLFLLLGFGLYLAYRIASPFLHTIILTIVLAVLVYPFYVKLRTRLHQRETLAALITTVILAVTLLAPVFIFITGLLNQGVHTLADVNNWIRQTNLQQALHLDVIDKELDWLQAKLPFLDVKNLDIQSKILELSRSFGQALFSYSTQIVANATAIVLRFLLMILMLFYLLRDGGKVLVRLRYLTPLRESQEDVILGSLQKVLRSFFLGTIVIAMGQGFAGGVGLAIAGLPALFWGTMMGFTSFIPVVGSSIIWIPATIYLFLVGKWQWAIFLAAWCILIVSTIDTVLRPIFLRGGSRLPILVIFLSLLGGMSVFGAIGILYGPLILSFVIVMLEIYGEEYRETLGRKKEGAAAEKSPEDAG